MSVIGRGAARPSSRRPSSRRFHLLRDRVDVVRVLHEVREELEEALSRRAAECGGLQVGEVEAEVSRAFASPVAVAWVIGSGYALVGTFLFGDVNPPRLTQISAASGVVRYPRNASRRRSA